MPDAVAAVILQDHLHAVHPAVQACVKKVKPPSMSLPNVARDIMDDQLASFVNKWGSFKNTTCYGDEIECTWSVLGWLRITDHLRTHENIENRGFTRCKIDGEAIFDLHGFIRQ